MSTDVIVLTDGQEHVMRHALGLVRSKLPYRNGFMAPAGHAERGVCEVLVSMGLMSCTDSYFFVTLVVFSAEIALVRVQWTGPWTAPGANPRWAYGQTHWIAVWRDVGQDLVFDVNGGMMTFDRWKAEVVPIVTAHVPRADGGWKPTHLWRLIGGGA